MIKLKMLATAVLTLAALAGTVGAANATAAPSTAGVHVAVTPNAWRYWHGPEGTDPNNAQQCVDYVRSINQLGVWDCEYYNPSPFRPGYPGWYATSPWYN